MNHSKKAQTKHSIHPLIIERWSARSFSDKLISSQTMEALFEAASWSASSMNEQPWEYLWSEKGSEAFDKMVDCLMDGNQPWAKNGSHMLLSLAKRKFEYKSRENRHHMHDVGAANSALLMQAAYVDIFGHMMGGFHMDKTLEAFGIDPEKYEIACLIVLGYLDAPEKLDEPFHERELAPRTRKPVSEFSKKLN
jgi:nitroreductase